MRISTKDGARAALIEAETHIKAGNLDAAEELMSAVETFNRASKGTNLLASLGGKSGDGDAREDGLLSENEVQYLNFASKAFGDKIIKSLRPEGQKALITTGSQVVGTPLVNTDPITLGKPVQSFLEAIPAVGRPPVYTYLRQTVRTPNATVVAPGATKPVSAMSLASVAKRLKIVATLSEPVNRYDLEDYASLQLFVQQELQYALRLAMENEVLNGDGTGEHFAGIKLFSGISTYTAPAGQTDDLIQLRKVLATYETTGETPNLIVMNPSDWTTLVTKRNTSGNFDLGGAVNEETRKAWGVPVALSGLVPANTGYVLGKDSINVSTDQVVHFESDGATGFAKNEISFRAETRAEVDIVRPTAITKITFVDA